MRIKEIHIRRFRRFTQMKTIMMKSHAASVR
ncbi:hypothetical protein PMI15_03964 [Polaromonas sp. CF318]|nr:hypothetical protein PMI15_03964 [Polaromonas sp. CF318]